MRMHVLSDLHLDHDEKPFHPPKVECDVVVLAGDINLGKKGFSWIREKYPDVPVIYVLGNHEFYNHGLPELTNKLRKEAANTEIHLLEKDSVCINGITFLGCTLWTDFKLHGPHQWSKSLQVASRGMTDFSGTISLRGFEGDDGHGYDFTAYESYMVHQESVKWLKGEFESNKNNPVVVVTHHAPCSRSSHPERKWSPLAPAFASNLDSFVETSGAKLWIHGHIHRSMDYLQGDTRVVSNPRGYPDSESGFDPTFTIDL